MRTVGLLAVGLAITVAGGATAAPRVSWARLPAQLIFGSVESDHGRLLVSGSASNGRGCAWVGVDPATLRIGRVVRAACTRPVRTAHGFVPVLFRDPRSFEVRVRTAHVLGPGRVSYGPVVMRFDEASDTHLEWAYGPGSLWLFDTETSHGAELLQISTATGRLEKTVPMPRIFRPLLAADEDGLWLAIATNGGFPGRGGAPIYHVSPDTRVPVLVQRVGRAALWLAASGQTVWVDVVSGTSREEIWRLDGPSGRARSLGSADGLRASAAVVEPGAQTLWAVSDVPRRVYGSCLQERVVTIDGRTGRRRTVSDVRLLDESCLYLGPGSVTFAFGALWFLDQQTSPNVLYGIRP